MSFVEGCPLRGFHCIMDWSYYIWTQEPIKTESQCTYIHTHVHMHTHTCVCTVRMYVRTYMLHIMYVCMYIHTYIRTYVSTYICIYICMYVRTCMCMYVEIKIMDMNQFNIISHTPHMESCD